MPLLFLKPSNFFVLKYFHLVSAGKQMTSDGVYNSFILFIFYFFFGVEYSILPNQKFFLLRIGETDNRFST